MMFSDMPADIAAQQDRDREFRRQELTRPTENHMPGLPDRRRSDIALSTIRLLICEILLILSSREISTAPKFIKSFPKTSSAKLEEITTTSAKSSSTTFRSAFNKFSISCR